MAGVTLLCGKIACGKTTYAEQLKKEKNAVLLSCDELMLILFDGCLGSKHDDMVSRCYLYFYKLAEQLVALNMEVVMDFGYWTKGEREFAKNYFREKQIPAQLNYIKIPEEQRINQLMARNETLKDAKERVYIIDETLRIRLDAKFEEPTLEELEAWQKYFEIVLTEK